VKINYDLKFVTNSWHKTYIKARRDSVQGWGGRISLSVFSSPHSQLHT